MSRGRVLLQVGVYVFIALVAGLAWGWTAGLLVGFLSLLVLVVGYAALYGGSWFERSSRGRFARRDRD